VKLLGLSGGVLSLVFSVNVGNELGDWGVLAGIDLEKRRRGGEADGAGSSRVVRRFRFQSVIKLQIAVRKAISEIASKKARQLNRLFLFSSSIRIVFPPLDYGNTI
jgi:hypothetical protein